MLIDLHVHTKKCKEGDSKKRNVDVSLFKEKVLLSGVSVLGITNHNHFDLEQYNLFREAVKDKCDVWPGIEFDVKQIDPKAGHVIVIVNPAFSNEFASVVNETVGSTDLDNFFLSVDDLVSLFNEFEPIFIPHCFKPKSLGQQDLEKLEKEVYNKSRLIKEPSNIASIGVLNSYDQKCLLGSDVQDWDDYEKGTFSELKFEFTGYRNFLKLLDKNVPYINDLLNKANPQVITVYGIASDHSFPFDITCYQDINIIFGDRGSGKSEIIDSLLDYYSANSVRAIKYKGGDKDSWFDDLLEVDISTYSFNDIGLEDNLADSFNVISSFQDVSPVAISNFRDYYKYQTNNKNALRIKIHSLSKANDNSLQKVNDLKQETIKISNFLEFFKTTSIYLSNPGKYSKLLEELENAFFEAFELYKKQWIAYHSNNFLDKAIDSISTAVSECVGHPPVPTKTGFYEYAIKRLALLSNVLRIKKSLDTSPKELSNEYIGNVGDKGSGRVVETICFINESNIEHIDKRWQNGKKSKYASFLRSLTLVERNIFGGSLSVQLTGLQSQLSSNEIHNIDFFLCVTKLFALNGVAYNPSKGEKCILSMQYELVSVKDDYSVFLLDEPESGLGNDYIEKNIVSLIKDLAKSNKTVFVATHNANIAVRTLPATSILKVVNNGCYVTYQGSMFTDMLANINNPSDVRAWRTESEIHLEGGKKAFAERGYYYAEAD